MRLHRGDIIRVDGRLGRIVNVSSYKSSPPKYSYLVRISSKCERHDSAELVKSYEEQVLACMESIIVYEAANREFPEFGEAAAKRILAKFRDLGIISKRQLEEI